MEILYILYTHNRPKVLEECLRSLFANNDLRPTRVVIIDDGSAPELKADLHRWIHATESVVDFVSIKRNIGYGRVAELGFAIASMYDPDYCFFLESDYIFRKNGLDEVMDVFESDFGQRLAGVAGYSHPDFFLAEATSGRYLEEIVAAFGEDNLNRDILYKPFDFQSRFGRVQVQFVSNSCGTMYLNWRLISLIRRAFYPRLEIEWIGSACNRGGNRKHFNDGIMSQGLAYFWSAYARVQGWDLSKYAALADIMPSVANHLCGLGITGNKAGIEEGETFVGSPSFPENYNVYGTGD